MKVTRAGIWPEGSKPAKDIEDSRPEDFEVTERTLEELFIDFTNNPNRRPHHETSARH